MKSDKDILFNDCKNILNKDKTIFISSAKFWCKFKEDLNRNIVNEQTLGTIIEPKNYKVFQTEF